VNQLKYGMPRVTEETVDHVARLAHLSLTAEERSTFARQLGQVLDLAESIQALDLSAVAPMSHAAEGSALRADEPSPGLPQERVMPAAPDTDAGLFRVPRVL
jgi:aspartyl-tRNA(Asn)/glutamyl-tRNA(Gln) amidotransferase subunit C